MKKKILLILVLPTFLLTIFAGGALAAKKPSHEAEKASVLYPNADGSETLPNFAPSPVIYEGGKAADCTAINPDSGVVVLENGPNQWGSTWYDEQQVGSMGRMIAVTSTGQREAAFMNLPTPPFPGNPRFVTYNCKNALNTWCGTRDVDGGTNINAGYTNIAVMHDGREAIIYDKTGSDEPWGTTLAMGDPGQVCSNGNYFVNHYDIPDSLYSGNHYDQKGIWPKIGIVYDSLVDTNYIHIVMTEGKPSGGNMRLGYVRCHLLDTYWGNLLCETPTGQPGVVSPITIAPNTRLTPNKLIANFGEVPGMSGQYPNTISAVVVTSPVSHKVAIVFTNKRQSGTVQTNNDVCYTESDSNGIKWFRPGKWPPTLANGMLHYVTNYWTGEKERAFTDVSACYDYNDSLHIVWNSTWWDSAAHLTNADANLYHWSQATGISVVAPGFWGSTPPSGKNVYCPWWGWWSDDREPGEWDRNVCKPSISALDPIYNPGGSPDSVFLFCTWTQFDSNDISFAGSGNGDIYASVSKNNGQCWGFTYNLTGTKTPDCDSGNCLSEHWSSLAQNMYGGDLHIEYVCDKDAGTAVQPGYYHEGNWTLNPMMYMHVQQLPCPSKCGAIFQNQFPPSWTTPPITLPPTGSRVISFKLKGIYNLGGNYEVTTDVPGASVTLNPSGFIAPGATLPVEITISCTGQAFKEGNVYIKTCKATVDEKTITLPVFVVCSNDYYECMRDPATQKSKDNGLCSLWVCANTEEMVWDKRLPADSNQVLFSGGAIAGFISETDTIVARQDYRDARTGARDTIKSILAPMDVDCNVKQVSVMKTYVWVPPTIPANPKWYWITINQQIILYFDKPGHTCPDWKKEQVIKHYWITWGRYPAWWPSPGSYAGHPDIYYGVFADIDAPFDTGCRTMSGESQSGCNAAGWDDVNKMVWQSGFPGLNHPEYANYHVGLALTNTAGAIVTPIGCKDVRNAQYLYPQNGWGWKDAELYTLAATPLNPATVVDNPDSVVDRSAVMTAGKIAASGSSTDTTWTGDFILIEALVRTGLDDLKAHIVNTRAIIPQLASAGMFYKAFPLCGDVNGDGKINASDVVCLINYLYVANSPPPIWPMCGADVNGDGKVNASDVVYLINYLFVANSPPPACLCVPGS